MPDPNTYRLAAPNDRLAVETLLHGAGLPATDLRESGVVLILGERGGRLLGCAGIEPRGRGGLIRSLAVVEDVRGQGLGSELAARAEALARSGGLEALYLLTNSAQAFWARRGYTPRARGEVPEAIRASAEFAALCPASALCMWRQADAASQESVAAGGGAAELAVAPEAVRARAETLFGAGLFCAESVVQALAQAQGVEARLLPRAATAFCSGMARTRGSCGAVTGAMMGLGVALGRDAPEDSVQRCYEATQSFVKAFEQRFGSSNCQVLLEGCDLATPEGQAMFQERGFRARCREFTGAAAELAQREIEAAASAASCGSESGKR